MYRALLLVIKESSENAKWLLKTLRAVSGLLLLTSMPTAIIAAELKVETWRGIQVVRLTGFIDENDAMNFSAAMGSAEIAAHGLPIVLLDSPGGSVMGALLLSSAMQIRPVHTIVPAGASCASACASIVFIAGRYRTVEAGGRFGQHSCSVGGAPDPNCNEIIAQHAFQHGVSHGSVSMFVTYVPPSEILWLGRADVDGWGISRYPGSDDVPFAKSEPYLDFQLTGAYRAGQDYWRIDNWFDGWRAFYRPVADHDPRGELSLYCSEAVPGMLFLSMSFVGAAVEEISNSITTAYLETDVFRLDFTRPSFAQINDYTALAYVSIPRAHVMDWLTRSEKFTLRFITKPPYDNIWISGSLSESRKNLIFAANHCAS